MSKKEAPIYGRRACLAVAERRPHHILRAFYSDVGPTKDLGVLLSVCAQNKRPYRAVSEEELEKLSGSKHHEGVVIFTERRERSYLSDAIERAVAKLDEPNATPAVTTWVALDGVANDHNLGAIARSLAWFGGAGLIWEGPRPQLSGAALRVAQGGAEEVELVAVRSLVEALEELKAKGVTVLGADQGARQGAFEVGEIGPVCWVLGNEQFGLSDEVRDCCDGLISIPGSGLVESLNVSVSAGILIAQRFQVVSLAMMEASRPKSHAPRAERGGRGGRPERARPQREAPSHERAPQAPDYEMIEVKATARRRK
jgi:RNA methyltransferase, TrmH family